MTNLFNTLAQGAKDTINGFDHRTGMGKLHIGVSAFMAFQVVAPLAAGYMPSPLSVIFAGISIGSAWNRGKQERQAGYPPRYIR